MPSEINQHQFEETMTGGMIDITANSEAIIDIWPYVALLVKQQIAPPYVFKKQLIEKVYRSGNDQYDHIILPAHEKDFFIVVIIDRNAKYIIGHHLLDLNKQYAPLPTGKS